MPWQLPNDHVEALRHPLRCFHDTDLKRGQVIPGPNGEPLALLGQSADVYEMRSLISLQRWAVKCYRAETPGLDRHYGGLTEHLLQIDLPCLVPFQYLERGLCVRGRWFPVVKMRWADGIPLDAFVRAAADRPAVLHQLARLWAQLVTDLRRIGVAHGALQADHVLVAAGPEGSPVALRLIDYDAMHVPALEGGPLLEPGHPNYQHPQRLWRQTYDAEADHFPHLLVYTALLAVAAGGRNLWERHDAGDNCLFKEHDLAEPATSAVFRELWRSPDPAVRALTGHLLLASQGSGSAVPLVEDLAASARTVLGGGPQDVPRFVLSGEQKLQVEAILGGDGEGHGGARRATREEYDPRRTFGVLVEEESQSAPGRATAFDDNFDLVVEDDPNGILLPIVPLSAPAPAFAALPAVPPPLPAAPPPVPEDPNTVTYHVEAWMPEQVAVMKVQGFVDSATGRVVSSVPGFMRVHLLDPYDLIKPACPGVLAWLGFVEQRPAQPRVLAIMDFELCQKETAHQKLLDVTLRIRPGDAPPPPRSLKWRKYCDKLFCDVRGYLMGKW